MNAKTKHLALSMLMAGLVMVPPGWARGAATAASTLPLETGGLSGKSTALASPVAALDFRTAWMKHPKSPHTHIRTDRRARSA